MSEGGYCRTERESAMISRTDPVFWLYNHQCWDFTLQKYKKTEVHLCPFQKLLAMLLNPKPKFFFKKFKSVTQTEVLKIKSSNTIWFKYLVSWFMLRNGGREIFESLFSVIKPLRFYKSRKLCMWGKNSWGHNRHWACIWVMVFCAAFTVIALCSCMLSVKCTCYMFRTKAVIESHDVTQARTPETLWIHTVFEFNFAN